VQSASVRSHSPISLNGFFGMLVFGQSFQLGTCCSKTILRTSGVLRSSPSTSALRIFFCLSKLLCLPYQYYPMLQSNEAMTRWTAVNRETQRPHSGGEAMVPDI
jgi:hypothetical protein